MLSLRWTRLLARALTGLLTVSTLIWTSGADMLFGSMLILVVVGTIAFGLWCVASFVVAVRPRTHDWFHLWGTTWIGCIAVLVGCAGLGFVGVAEDVRIELSRSALIEAGENVLAGEHPDRAGLYGFQETIVSGDSALLETGTFAIDSFGIAYCPKGGRPGFTDLGGGLYAYSF